MNIRTKWLCATTLLLAVTAFIHCARRSEKMYQSWVEYCDTASLAQAKCEYEKAESLYMRGLEVAYKLDPEGEIYAKTLESIAVLQLEISNYSNAESFLCKSLSIRERYSGKYSMDVANNLVRLAQVHIHTKRYDEAESELLRVRSIILANRLSGTIRSTSYLNTIGFLHEKQCEYDQAEIFYKECLGIERKYLRHDDPALASSLRALASVYIEQSMYDQAERLLNEAVDITEKNSSQDPLAYTRALNSLAVLHTKSGNTQQAEKSFEKCLSVFKTHYGSTCPQANAVVKNYSVMLEMTGNPTRAEAVRAEWK